MKNYFKKFSIMFVMSLVLVLGCCTSVFTVGDGVIGISNLNNTTENSAKVGDVLKFPEIGWKRYDDSDNRIIYDSNMRGYPNSQFYNGTYHDPYASPADNSKTTIKFYGSKFRIISSKYASSLNESKKLSVTLDGKVINCISTINSVDKTENQIMGYEKKGLPLGIHTVVLNPEDRGDYLFDAIDIDNNGYLIPYSGEQEININSSLNLKVNDSKQLTATTTPAGAEITWTSSDSTVATVNSTGKITGIKEGQATITAQIKGSETKATCIVTVTKEATTEPTNPPVDEPTGDRALFIELIDGNIKSYDVSSNEITKFINWYKNRDNDDSQLPYYKFTKGTYTDYVIHGKIDWFEIR